jgi:hypothetical protein
MGAPLASLKGKRFGKLVVLHRRRDNDDYGRIRWVTRCDCGRHHEAMGYTLRNGQSSKCKICSYSLGGRCVKYRYTYHSYRAMIERCTNQRNVSYGSYGGRGIQVCPQWQGETGFIQFLVDIGQRPKGKTLDRKNPEGHYEPGNVRWATPVQQGNNRRQNYEEDELIQMRKEADKTAKTFEEQEAELSGACF